MNPDVMNQTLNEPIRSIIPMPQLLARYVKNSEIIVKF